MIFNIYWEKPQKENNFKKLLSAVADENSIAKKVNKLLLNVLN